jgi:acetyl esterase/lipase
MLSSVLLLLVLGQAGEAVSPMTTDAAEWNHQRDVVYGYKDGMALVMDVFTPRGNRNGAAVIRMMSGGMVSSPKWSHRVTNDRAEVRSLLKTGYVVFAVAHSCQPKYTINEIFPDITRAVRFIRHNAVRFGIDPQRIGIMGASSGGHLSLLVATAALAASPDATDPVDRESSRVQAVVAYYPGTDNLNFGRENVTILEHFRAQGEPARATFDFHRWDDQAKRFERVTDPDLIRTLFREASPVAHVSDATAPVLILHGDEDKLVPLQQSEVFVARLREVGVPHRLFIVSGVGHGYSNGWKKPMQGEIAAILDWFDQHLLGNKK